MITIKTYLCRKRLLAVDFAERSLNAVSVSDGLVSAKIMPLGFNVGKRQVNAKLVSSGANLIECLSDTPYLKWTRRAISVGDDFAGLERLITIEGNIPNLPCMWEAAYVYGITLSAADHHMLIILKPDRTGGEIPESKSDVCKIETDFVSRNIQTNIVPGELLQLAWTIKVDGKLYSKPMAGAWFETPTFTGGKLIEKKDEKNTNRYTANVIGVNQECLATDWAQYSVGDWVYVLKQQGPEATKCDRESEYNQSHFESFVFRLIPITVNDFGNEGGDFEKKNYSLKSGGDEFARFFEAGIHTGTIIDVYTDTDEAKVNVKELGPEKNQDIEFDRIPVFYHCEDSTSIKGGSSAFQKNDEVLVLNEGGHCSPSADDLCIVGFTDGIRDCAIYIKATIKGGIGYNPSSNWQIRLTQPIESQVYDPYKGITHTENYTILGTVHLDQMGVAVFYKKNFLNEINPDQPLHLWISNDSVFQLYTTDWRGPFPQFGISPDLKWLVVTSGTNPSQWQDPSNYGLYNLDKVWGLRKEDNIAEYEKTAFTDAQGQTVNGWLVDFQSPKQIRVNRQCKKTTDIPALCGSSNYLENYTDAYPRISVVNAPKRKISGLNHSIGTIPGGYSYAYVSVAWGPNWCPNYLSMQWCWDDKKEHESMFGYYGSEKLEDVEDKSDERNQPQPCFMASRDGLMSPDFNNGNYFAHVNDVLDYWWVFTVGPCHGDGVYIGTGGWYTEDKMEFTAEDIF